MKSNIRFDRLLVAATLAAVAALSLAQAVHAGPAAPEVPSTSALARTAALPAPVVFSATSPVSALFCVETSIDCPAVKAMNAEEPPTVSTPLCVMPPVAATTARLLPTFESPRSRLCE